jgi:hypothetical protein
MSPPSMALKPATNLINYRQKYPAKILPKRPAISLYHGYEYEMVSHAPSPKPMGSTAMEYIRSP